MRREQPTKGCPLRRREERGEKEEKEEKKEKIKEKKEEATEKASEGGEKETSEESSEESTDEAKIAGMREAIGKAAESRGIDPADATVAGELLETIAGEYAKGELSESAIEALLNAADYKRAVSAADAAGELRGRNAAIEAQLLEDDDSDGLPHPGTGHPGAKPKNKTIFDLARGAM